MEKTIVEFITEELIALTTSKKNLKDVLKRNKISPQKSNKPFLKSVKKDLLLVRMELRTYKTVLNLIEAKKESKDD